MIVVAGGTGQLGSLVANRLSARGHQVRVLSRGLSAHPGVLDPAVEVVRADVRDVRSLTPATAGADVVVSCVQGFVSPGGATPESVDKQGNINLVEAARGEAAEVVLVSMAGASADSPMELARMKYAAEEHLKASGLGWTIVRGAAFAQVWLDLLAGTAGPSGRPMVFGNADNPIPWVDIHEVAELVTRAVEDPGLRGETLDICGPESLTLMQLALAFMDSRSVPGRPRRVPRPMLHVMASTVGRFKPELGRQARAALAMDVLPATDDADTRARFPDIPRRPVSEIVADLGTAVA